ncbi:S8 family serine peptidase [Adhaeribacter rhizoryzae]|uniref:S8 family serine peptidase n=1 Tax=Adhaeribacter rhizoryzae TaxID=2607907 RepID=A0A5M6DIP2_9BACT|nr:S8 family serine peptidase [Adhaeribacter rhizoryzae]KAA5547448.1 S8 family serine peptidase [Adhaeribacter rhizoryzae]
MIRILRRVFILSQLVFLSGLSQAQQLRPLVPAKTDLNKLQKIATDQNQSYKLKQDKILKLAQKHKWVINHTLPNGSYISLQDVAENGRPIYYETLFNLTSAITTNTNKVWQGGTSGLNLSGANPLLAGKLGIWDGGAVRKTHQELAGRIVQRDGATALNDHATHVAGTMIAKGVSANIKGMAHGALDLQAWNFNNDNSEIAAAASGLLVSNHSYGNVAGWRLIGTNWYWYGDITVNEKDDVNFGYYSSTSQLWDNIAFNAPYYLMVKAAGNSRNMAEPAVGQPYYRYNPAIGNYELMPGRTADMRFYNGYDVIPDHSVAKNILTVGAIQGIPNGYKQPSDAVAYVASSWGPTDDGRIKPDLVGNGIAVTSSMAASDNNYNYASGTSMAAPNITGSLFLLQEHFANRNNGRFMLAATLKGLAIHTANEAGSTPGPDYIYGWGVMNTEGAAKVISNIQQKYSLTERTLIQGQTYTQSVVAAGTEPLRVTISWTDPAGTVLPMIPSTLNNRTPRLVNDLDVRVSNSRGVAQPWILDPSNPSAAATTGDNIRDNVEQVLITNATPGETYTVTVSHKGALKNSIQNYSLIMSGLQGLPYCVSKPVSATGARIENVTLGTINNSTTTCGTYADYTSLTANAEVGQVMPLSVKIGTCDAAANTILKVFADWNEDGDFTDNNELVATSGVLTTSTTYTTSVTVPTTVQSGNSARLRLVLVETDIAETVSSCGTYDKGETEDYALNFTTPLNDIGISALNIPTASNLYANPDQSVTVSIKNFGLAAQTNIPVSVKITQGTQQIAILTGTYTGTIASGKEKTFTLPGSFPVVAGAAYTITATTALATDPVVPNNEYQTIITAQTVAQMPVIAAASCDANANVTLTGSGNGILYWYDALVGGNLIAAGNNTTTGFKPQDKTYYAALNEFTGTTAALNNATAGTFANSTQDTVYFNATVPFVLDRLTINAKTAGTATLNLYNTVNTLIGSSEINLIPGVNQYSVNLNIPAAGNKYRLLLNAFTGGATANRNEAAGTLAFPYAIPNILTITKSTTNSLYFYNWKIKAVGAPSARAKAILNGTITATETNVCANNNSGTITFNGGGNILRWEQSADGLTWTSLAYTQNSYTYTNLSSTTVYRVIFGNATCAEIASEAITVTVNPVPAATITANGATKLCAGSSLMLVASPGFEYLWSTGETTQSITVTQPGNYSVEVKNASGCTTKSTVLAVTNCLTTWTGTTDTNWNNTANWSNGIPDADMDVNVPTNVKYSPAVSAGTATCKSIVIAGSLTINGGTVKVNENFTNNGTFNQTSGTLELTGKGAQKIKGNSFLNLRMGGASTKTLTSDITVTGSLTVTEGVVNTGAYKIILDQAATLSETSSNYVVGKVIATRTFSKTNAKHTFGDMGLALTTNASPSPTIEVTRVTGNPGNSIWSVKRQFEIHVTAGKNTDLNATMEFSYLPGELNGLVKEHLALYRSTDDGLTWTVQSKSLVDLNADANKVTLNNISAFSTWTLADRDPSMVLPVSLSAFKATKQKNDVVVTWETAMEKNAAGMEVEVSTDTKNYRTLGFVAATGINTNTSQQYQFTDTENNKVGTRYYRLKQLDQDGKFTYYGPKAVTFNDPVTSTLAAYPNPSNGTFALTVQAAETAQTHLDIKNIAGQSVYNAQKQLSKGNNNVTVNLPAGTKPGVYVVLARYNNTLQTLKIVVE